MTENHILASLPAPVTDMPARNLPVPADVYRASGFAPEPDTAAVPVPLSHYLWILRRNWWKILLFVASDLKSSRSGRCLSCLRVRARTRYRGGAGSTFTLPLDPPAQLVEDSPVRGLLRHPHYGRLQPPGSDLRVHRHRGYRPADAQRHHRARGHTYRCQRLRSVSGHPSQADSVRLGSAARGGTVQAPRNRCGKPGYYSRNLRQSARCAGAP